MNLTDVDLARLRGVGSAPEQEEIVPQNEHEKRLALLDAVLKESAVDFHTKPTKVLSFTQRLRARDTIKNLIKEHLK